MGSDLMSPVWGRATTWPRAWCRSEARERMLWGKMYLSLATTSSTCEGDGLALDLFLLPRLYRPMHLQHCKVLLGETGFISATTVGLFQLSVLFHWTWSSSHCCDMISVSLNSACTLSLLSSEICVLAHPLEQLHPSVNGSTVLLCSAAVLRDSLQQT